MSHPQRERSVDRAPDNVQDDAELNLVLALQNIGAVRAALGHEPIVEVSERPALYTMFTVLEIEAIRLLGSGAPFSFFTRELQRSPEEITDLINAIAAKFGAESESELRRMADQFARNPEGFFPGVETALSRADSLVRKAGELLAQADFLIEGVRKREGANPERIIGKTAIVSVAEIKPLAKNADRSTSSLDEDKDTDTQVTELSTKASHLTERERQILGYIAKGSSRTQIAERLGIQSATVGLHLRHAWEKLGAKDLGQGVEWWNQLQNP